MKSMLQNIYFTHLWFETTCTCTVKPAHAVTCIKQSPLLKGNHFLPYHRIFLYEMNLF